MRRQERDSAGKAQARVLIVAPLAPPYGGMALQAALLQRMLLQDGISADLMGHNDPLGRSLGFFEPVAGVRTILKTIRFCLRFWKRVRCADVIHILAASGLHFTLVVCPAICMARWNGKPVVLNYRAGDADRFLKSYGWFAKPFFKAAAIITTPSGFLAEVIQRRIGVPVSIVPNIVNFSLFRYRDRSSSLQPKMIVTRHLEKIYDVESIIQAFRQVQENHPDASLRIAGTGSQEARLRELVSAWKLKNVSFLGYVDHQTLPELYGQCDILLNASRVDNFPGSLMEASAAGLVVLSTNVGGIPFIYQDGKNALLVEVGDWKGLAAAVERVLADRNLARELAKEALAACRQCEWQNVRRALYAAYGFHAPRERCEPESGDSQFVCTTGQ